MHTPLLIDTAPPGMPPEDDDSPDGGEPPRRSDPLAAIDRICARAAADVAFLDRIVSARIEIGNLRRQRLHLTADIQCDQLWCELEAWIDPQRGAAARDI